MPKIITIVIDMADLWATNWHGSSVVSNRRYEVEHYNCYTCMCDQYLLYNTKYSKERPNNYDPKETQTQFCRKMNENICEWTDRDW